MLADMKKPIQTIAGVVLDMFYRLRPTLSASSTEMGSLLQGIVMDYDSDFDIMLKRRTILQTITLEEVKAIAQKVSYKTLPWGTCFLNSCPGPASHIPTAPMSVFVLCAVALSALLCDVIMI